jgi:hypothetical protein
MTHRTYLTTAVLLVVRGRKRKITLSALPAMPGTRIDKIVTPPIGSHRVTESGRIIGAGLAATPA